MIHHLRVSLYALMLAAAGIPLYIHLPQFASINLGMSLATVGVILMAIRVIDLVQDPLIGWAIDRWPQAQLLFAVLAAAGLAVGFPMLFLLQPGPWVVVQLVSVLILLFTAYSLGTILLYGRSATLAIDRAEQGLMTLAAFREGGILAGVILAAIAPAVLVAFGAGALGYPAFGLVLGGLAVFVALVSLPIWRRPVIVGAAPSLSGLGAAGALRLLGLALVNSLPVAITSTLFLFFVEDRLKLPGLAGPLLTLFFLSAGLSVPVWTAISRRLGARRTLLVSMPMAIAGFIWAAFLGPGDVAAFAIICLAAGAALGAEMLLLPAMFSVALTQAGLQASLAFGIWTFAGKLGLALAAFLVMPLLQWNGFQPGQANSPEALNTLGLAYAVLPCVLKLGALALVLRLPDTFGAGQGALRSQ